VSALNTRLDCFREDREGSAQVEFSPELYLQVRFAGTGDGVKLPVQKPHMVELLGGEGLEDLTPFGIFGGMCGHHIEIMPLPFGFYSVPEAHRSLS